MAPEEYEALYESHKKIERKLARYKMAEKELPEEPNYLRLRNGFTTGVCGNQEPTYGEYVTRSDYDALRAHAVKVTAELAAARKEPTLEECFSAGKGPEQIGGFLEGGLSNTPEERARFEAYMRGHCWEAGKYDDALRGYDTVISRMLYGVWRDRGLLATIKPTEFAAAQVSASGDSGLTGSEPAPSADTIKEG